MDNIIKKVKQKKEFSGLPDSIVKKVTEIKKNDVKESRALLRKYFGVFLTNKILKGKLSAKEMLLSHISSKKRNYEKFYREIFHNLEFRNENLEGKGWQGEGNAIGSVIDLGCGANGFSYSYLKKELGDVDYVGIEAVGQLVGHMNKYFLSEGFPARVIIGDLFNIDEILNVLKKQRRHRVVFLFQVVDALENLERDFSKKLILEISKECELIVISLPTESLGGRKKFEVQRKWLIDFLEDNFVIKKDFKIEGEWILVISKM